MARLEVKVEFTVQRQFEFRWCWAAVGVSCALAYDESLKETQCTVVRNCLKCGCFCCGDPLNKTGRCCNNLNLGIPGCGKQDGVDCDEMGVLLSQSGRLGAFDVLKINNDQIFDFTFEQITTEIEAGRLIAFLMEHRTKPVYNHFLIVNGYRIDGDRKKVIVSDPFFKSSIRDFDEFKDLYRYHQNTRATQMFLTKGANKLVPRRSSSWLPRNFVNRLNHNMDFIFAHERFKANNKQRESSYKVFVLDWEELLKNEEAVIETMKTAQEREERVFQVGSTNELESVKSHDDRFAPMDAVEFGERVKEHQQLFAKLKPNSGRVPFEHWVVVIDGILVEAIWFRTKDRSKHEEDFFVPLRPSFHELASDNSYSLREFVQIVRRAAKKLEEEEMTQ